jgi:hypothetical protein
MLRYLEGGGYWWTILELGSQRVGKLLADIEDMVDGG